MWHHYGKGVFGWRGGYSLAGVCEQPDPGKCCPLGTPSKWLLCLSTGDFQLMCVQECYVVTNEPGQSNPYKEIVLSFS